MIHLTPEQHVFLIERHLATLTTLRADGSPHVVPVGFTWDPETGLVRIITSGPSVKARNAARPGPGGTAPRAAVCQVDGGRWITLEGPTRVSDDPDRVLDAERRYARRYKEPSVNPRRVVIEITADRVMSSSYMQR